jgi:glyoxylase-like metal-dependent hydrolase (beta-lactamase superfamily II)
LLDFRIISLGTLAAHPLWDEKAPMRTGHATTTLISADGRHILVDPSLPGSALLARMSERTRVKPADVTHVFLTSLDPERRRGLREFEHAEWLVHEPEREDMLKSLKAARREAHAADDRELITLIEHEMDTVQRFSAAPDSLAAKVDLFPLPGVTAGNCGLLLALPASTILLCGDAIPTLEHLAQGKVLSTCVNIEQAQESFREAVEIADAFILGRDNITMNPLRRM